MGNKEKSSKVTLAQQFLRLPTPLQSRVSKNFLAASIIALAVIIFAIVLKNWKVLSGLVISVYMLILGLEIVKQYGEGKVICKKMLVVKVTKTLKAQQITLLMREVENVTDPEKAIHKFYVPASKEDVELLTVDTILNVYYRPDHTMELTAWEIVGHKGN